MFLSLIGKYLVIASTFVFILFALFILFTKTKLFFEFSSIFLDPGRWSGFLYLQFFFYGSKGKHFFLKLFIFILLLIGQRFNFSPNFFLFLFLLNNTLYPTCFETSSNFFFFLATTYVYLSTHSTDSLANHCSLLLTPFFWVLFLSKGRTSFLEFFQERSVSG